MGSNLADLPTGALVAIGVFAVVQLVLDVIAIVDLVRRPVDRVTGGNKWLWVAVILLVNTIGAILYLAIGRKAAPAADVAAPPVPGAGTASIADALYGPRPDDGR